MRDLRLMIGAGQVEEVAAVGAYLRIKSASVPLLIEIEGGKSRFEIAKGGSANLMPFQRFSVSHSSGTDQAVVIAVGEDGEEQTEGVMTGEVAVSNPIQRLPALLNFQRVTVTSAAGMLISANPTRSTLLIKNQHDFGAIWIKPLLAGGATQPGTGWKLGPGEALEIKGVAVFTGQLQVVGDIASNPDVILWEC